MDITWTNEHDRQFLASAGLCKLDHFWNLENSGASVEFTHLKSKISKAGHIIKQVTCIKALPSKYYLKKACGPFSELLHNEFKRLPLMPSLGIQTPRLVAHFIDSSAKKILIIYKNLVGYNSLEALFNNTASPDALLDFSMKKREIIRELLEIRRRLISSGLIFNAWDPAHVFIRQKSLEIALIDLEHLISFSEMPFIMKNPIALSFLRFREWRSFKKSLGSKVYTDKFLKDIIGNEA
ncbi:MAG: hypothetical protein QXH80_02240 [Candidatus Nanoarchaeia archaeon]